MSDSPGFDDPAQDDAFRSLFRPAEPRSEPEPEVEPVVQEPRPAASTGRLFRSRGAQTQSDTIVALSADEAAQLRSMSEQPARAEVAVPTAAAVAVPASTSVAAFEPSEPPARRTAPAQTPEEVAAMSARRRQEPGLAPGAVYILVIGVTLIAGFIDAYLSGTGLGWITGIALLIISVYCAVRVRVSQISVSVIAPPIAFGLAAITVGQIGQSRAGGALLAWINNSFFSLADNWFWVIATTLACLVIAVVRSRR